MAYELKEPFWQVVYQWQTLIAGVLALIAGAATVWATIVAASREISAAQRQTKVAQEQIGVTLIMEQRRLARTSLIAVRLLDGILSGIDEDINRELGYVGTRDGQNLEGALARACLNRIRKPGIEMIWEQLEVLDPEVIRNYMSIDREISRMWNSEIISPSINSMLDDLRKLLEIVNFSRELLTAEAHRSTEVLARM